MATLRRARRGGRLLSLFLAHDTSGACMPSGYAHAASRHSYASNMVFTVAGMRSRRRSLVLRAPNSSSLYIYSTRSYAAAHTQHMRDVHLARAARARCSIAHASVAARSHLSPRARLFLPLSHAHSRRARAWPRPASLHALSSATPLMRNSIGRGHGVRRYRDA